MITRTSIGLGVVALVVVTGLATKAVRYTAAAPVSEQSAVDRIKVRLEHQGWTQVGGRQTRKGDLYDWLEFERPACAARLAVGLLGAAPESAELFRRDHGGHAAFLQEGRVRPSPSGMARQLGAARRAVLGAIGWPVEAPLPLLGLAHVPGDDRQGTREKSSTCGTGTPEAWRTLLLG